MGMSMEKQGTYVARESSNMIHANEMFSTIVESVNEGNLVWDNLCKILNINNAITNDYNLSVLMVISGLDCIYF